VTITSALTEEIMTDGTAATPSTEQIGAAAETLTAAITHTARRLWLAGLGIAAFAAEHAQEALETLEQKGQEIEPAVTAPFKRAGDAANAFAQRAGQSVRSVGDAVGHARTTMTAGVFKAADVRAEVARIVEETLPAALQRLDLPTRADFRALAAKVDELASKDPRSRNSHTD
jgi:poly(hydroxyalkanoate) granule-associated protein